MSPELKQKVYNIILKEYKNHHRKIIKSRRPSWYKRLDDLGIKIFCESPPSEGCIVISNQNAAMGEVQMPVDVAERILVLGGFP